MKCCRLQLWERRNVKRLSTNMDDGNQSEKPRRYCQQKLVNPGHEEDPRWAPGSVQRFRYDQEGWFSEPEFIIHSDGKVNKPDHINGQLYLTVLNIKFPGDCLKSKFMRTSFKYKMPSAENCHSAHRMFVKQPVEDVEVSLCNESQSEYKLDDYVKNILNGNDMTRPPTSVSGFLNQHPVVDHQVVRATEMKENILESKESIESVENEDTDVGEAVEEVKTMVKYQSVGKRRSLTISRAQSPESVQVIRVDVVCNYSGRSSVTSFGEKRDKIEFTEEKSKLTKDYIASMKHRAAYTNKYIPTNTLKQLDETTGAGDKVTLLCKTYKLANRLTYSNGKTSELRNAITTTNKRKAKV